MAQPTTSQNSKKKKKQKKTKKNNGNIHIIFFFNKKFLKVKSNICADYTYIIDSLRKKKLALTKAYKFKLKAEKIIKACIMIILEGSYESSRKS